MKQNKHVQKKIPKELSRLCVCVSLLAGMAVTASAAVNADAQTAASSSTAQEAVSSAAASSDTTVAGSSAQEAQAASSQVEAVSSRSASTSSSQPASWRDSVTSQSSSSSSRRVSSASSSASANASSSVSTAGASSAASSQVAVASSVASSDSDAESAAGTESIASASSAAEQEQVSASAVESSVIVEVEEIADESSVVEENPTVVTPPPEPEIVYSEPEWNEVARSIATEDGAEEIEAVAYSERAETAVERINEARVEAGLVPLSVDAFLSEAALQRAMEQSLQFGHDRPDGSEWYSIADEVTCELLAQRYERAQSVVDAWLDSPGHWAGLLDEHATRIGVACVDTEDGFYWALLLGA